MKNYITFFFVFLSFIMVGQRFTFSPEVGIACSQVDGDWLQGFDKRGLMVGVNSNYYFKDQVALGFSAKYVQLGSDNGGSRQNRPTNSIQFESDFDVANVGVNLLLSNSNRKYRFSGGISYNRVFGYKVNTIIFISNNSTLSIDKLTNNFLSYNFSFGLNLFDQFTLKVSFDKAFNNLASDALSSDVIKSFKPYYLSYSIMYEIDPNPKRKKAAKKRRRKKR